MTYPPATAGGTDCIQARRSYLNTGDQSQESRLDTVSTTCGSGWVVVDTFQVRSLRHGQHDFAERLVGFKTPMSGLDILKREDGINYWLNSSRRQ